MDKENPMEEGVKAAEGIQKTRRTFVKTAAQVAVTAPAVSILLASTTKPAAAQVSPYTASQLHILDDFTFGNTHEDVDAIERSTNFSNWNHTNNKDDVFTPPT